MITDLEAKRAKPKDKPYMIRDDRGLYLRVDPTGRKYWILRYWENRREHQLSLGPYPDISLRDARLKRDEIQTARAMGESPRARPAPSVLFGDLTEDWATAKLNTLSESYQKATRLRIAKYIASVLAARTASSITSGEILQLLRKAENAGYIDTAKRLKVIIGQIFRYGIAAGVVESDPTAALAGALQSRSKIHYPAPTSIKDISTIIQTISAYPYPIVRGVLLLQLYTAARPGEVRAAEWSEMDADRGEWRIPAGKMKMRRPHIVPLVRQAQQLLGELRPFTGAGRWLFPSARDTIRPISDAAARLALRGMGFSREVITPHGFRAMFSTWANERNYPPDIVEACLAHQDRNAVRAAYNRAEYLDQRRELLQEWADWLEGLAASSPIEEAGPTFEGRE